MVDFRRFLAAAERVVLPHFGGITLEAKERRLRLRKSCEPGWWRFRLEGRHAEVVEPAEPEGLEDLPIVRGHYTRGRLVREGAISELLWFVPEEPPRFALLRGRRWPSGALIYDGPELEGDAEEAVRLAYQDRRGLEGLRGVPSSLRAAFNYTTLFEEAEARGLPISPLEVRRSLSFTAAERAQFWAELVSERERALREQHQQAQVLLARARSEEILAARAQAGRTEAEVVEGALLKSEAQLLDLRSLQDQQLEVIFRVDGERFVALIRADTLQVLDAGICLSGHDEDLTLESLPGVIREAIQDEVLVITRHS